MKRFSALLLFLFVTYGSCPAMNFMSWSNWLFKPICSARFNLFCFNHEDALEADPECQKLGKEAQNALKIPLKDQLPIKFVPAKKKFDDDAITGPKAIYINAETFKHLSYGQKRTMLFHEAAHAKYYDATIFERTVAKMAAFGLMGFLCLKKFPSIHSNLKQHIGEGLPLLYVSAVILFGGLPSINLEKRADTQGAYACECYECVHQFSMIAPIRWGGEWDIESPLAKGYLSRQELETIRDTLKSKNKLCEVHKKESQNLIAS